MLAEIMDAVVVNIVDNESYKSTLDVVIDLIANLPTAVLPPTPIQSAPLRTN